MKRIAWLLFFCLAPALGAQAPADTGGREPHPEFRQRREARVREALGLTAEQATKLTATRERFTSQRRTILERERAIRRALRGQLIPGVAANVDSVRKLLDAEEQGFTTLVQLRHDQLHEMAGYLTPVQLARFELIRQARMARFASWRGRMRGERGRAWGGGRHGQDGPDGRDGSDDRSHGPRPT